LASYIFIILYFGKFRNLHLWINIRFKENIKIALFYLENSKNFQVAGNKQSPALLSQGRANFSGWNEQSSFPPQENKFVFGCSGSRVKRLQTFSIILPNLIHNSKKRDLKN